MGKRWLPLESNPYVLNHFVSKLGYDTSKFFFCDVLGLDEDLLQLVPTPVIAVILLCPVTKEFRAAKAAEDHLLKQQGYTPDPDVYFMKQTIRNACGTMGALHAIANNQDKSEMAENSFLRRFLADSASMDPEQRAHLLENPPEGYPDIDEAHESADAPLVCDTTERTDAVLQLPSCISLVTVCGVGVPYSLNGTTLSEAAAKEGDTAPPPLEDEVGFAYAALVNKNNRLVELDGSKSFPIDHGKTSDSTILQDSVAVLKRHIQNANTIQFNMIALAKRQL